MLAWGRVHSHMVADLHISDSDDEATPTSRQGSPERRHRAQAHEHDAQSHVYRRPGEARPQGWASHVMQACLMHVWRGGRMLMAG